MPEKETGQAGALSDEAAMVEESGNDDNPGPQDMARFRRATLRARLAAFGVPCDPGADEIVLRRMVRIAEQRQARRNATGGGQ